MGRHRARRAELRRPGRLRAHGGHGHPAGLRRAQCRRRLRASARVAWSPLWPCVTTALSVLASGQGTGNISLGAVAVVGFLAAAGRRQYVAAGRGGRAAPGRRRTGPGGARPGRRPGRAGQRGPGDPRHPGPQPGRPGAPARRAWTPSSSAETPDHGRAVELLARARALAVEGLSEAQASRRHPAHRSPAPRRRAAPARRRHRQRQQLGDHRNPESRSRPKAPVALRRTAQEGLTNAAKHAPGAAPTVQLAFVPARSC